MPTPTTQSRATRVATQTKARRQAAGRYSTPTQRSAFQKRMSEGIASLSKAELEALAQYGALTLGQRAEYKALAAECK